ncbi:MAG: hypothetical protein ABI867_43910, partial [Kofleriaceae bacterium]
MTDFVSLARAARDLPGPDTHARLWSAWFTLPAWHFIKARSPSGWMPYSEPVNGVRCILAFTDPIRADGYVRMAGLWIDPRVVSPVLSLTPEHLVQLVPQLRTWGVEVLCVDPGPDAFYSQLEGLFAMLRNYRAPIAPPPRVVAPPTPATSFDALLALPAWHVMTSHADPSFPELADRGTDLVAQVYSSTQMLLRAGSPASAMMTPRDALALFTGIELINLVRFDGELEVQL